MAGFASIIYNSVFRRNQIFLATVFASAFALEMGLDVGGNKIWDYINRGRQWKDIKHNYIQSGEGGDDDEE